MQIGFILISVIAIFIAIFAIQNGTPVPIDLFLARYEVPLALLIMVCIIVGAVIVLLLGTMRTVKKGFEIKDIKNKLKQLENEKIQFDKALQLKDTEILNLTNNKQELAAKLKDVEDENKKYTDEIAGLKNQISKQKSEMDTLNESVRTINKNEESQA